jgi:hypothetical protein
MDILREKAELITPMVLFILVIGIQEKEMGKGLSLSLTMGKLLKRPVCGKTIYWKK